MKYAIVFTLFGLTCAFYALTSPTLGFRFIAGSFAVAFIGVGLAYAFIGPRAFLKQANGKLSPLSYFLFWPYHLMNALSLWGFRRSARENDFDQIADNLYLGCRLGRSDEKTIENLGFVSVLDLTCEFGATPAFRQLNYRCIPLLDTRAPSVEQLLSGARWIENAVAKGPIYVHCALGHGRSATFVAAYLLLAKKARSPQEAVDKIKVLRPKIGLHPEQLAALEKLAATL